MEGLLRMFGFLIWKALESKNVTDNIANDELPMWAGDKVYYLSDQGVEARFNLWVYDTKKGDKQEQITNFTMILMFIFPRSDLKILCLK